MIRSVRRSTAQLASILLVASAAHAGPNLAYDDPRWNSLLDSIAKGLTPDSLGGVQWTDDDRAVGTGFWASPFRALTLRVDAASEHDRPYSLPVRPRDIAGEIALSCEYQEGRPCGDGARAGVELDSAAGWGSLLTAVTRVRVGGGTNFGDPVQLDRAYLKFQYGPLLAQLGRDVLVLGPSVRGALMVSSNAVPQDGFRIQLRPVQLPFVPVRLSLFYFIDRLRAPQRYTGTLVDCTRIQFDVTDYVQLGGSRLLQIGGEGAPYYGGFWGFIGEHFGVSREFAGGSAENNRISGDISVRVPSLAGAHVYWEFAFEDARADVLNSFQYDADQLVGVELRDLHLGSWRRLFVEFTRTGRTSQEHGVFTTGMTNGGRTLGTALGPDAMSIWLRADLTWGGTTISPWAEWLRFGSDTYGNDPQRGVFVTSIGPIEHRQRVGADVTASLPNSLLITAGVFAERVANVDLAEGATRINGGARLAVTYTP